MISKVSQSIRKDKLKKFVKIAKRRAKLWINYGKTRGEELAPFCHDITIKGIGIRAIFTRDYGHHSGGWFKNPDYERCFHLSLSFRSPDGIILLSQNHKIAKELCQMFYGGNTRLIWIESPFSKDGKLHDVWHYRLFVDYNGQPILPRGEVYSKEFTEIGWKSFSEIYGHKPLNIV